ncbi:MAG: hypothetical protein E6H00_17465 [Bacillati bacterium ANGP1]|uniref:Tetrapyrrole methylase domain-containing protein n=1 Tax=Candidatus Segetimicrobium genomatis TaxID=2569760 RepID=A0A537JUD2_9BACT|nr:MAG: hypothetical protein E6H00_17465 [Terrabacteria group bacterium ANGP1]
MRLWLGENDERVAEAGRPGVVWWPECGSERPRLRRQGQPVSSPRAASGGWCGAAGRRAASVESPARSLAGSDSNGGVMPARLKASLVGVGPGSPELVTPTARRAIEAAEIVLGWDLDLKPVEDVLADKNVFLQDVKKASLEEEHRQWRRWRRAQSRKKRSEA